MWHNPEDEYFFVDVEQAFDQEMLAKVCETHEEEFDTEFGFEPTFLPDEKYPDNYYYFKDNGSKILAVGHLDTVMPEDRRAATFAQTEAGPVIHSGALDDRLGVYVITQLLPMLGIETDILLTVGEESGCSTAQHFNPPPDKEYNWMIEFDRGGTDVVMYQYHDSETARLVRNAGAVVGNGIFSDIAYLEHLGIKGFNWGVGYQDYHGPRSHAYLHDTFMMVAQFLRFYLINEDNYLYHEQDTRQRWGSYRGGLWGAGGYSTYGRWGDDDDWREDREFMSKASLDDAEGDDTDPYAEEGGSLLDGERVCDRLFGKHDHDDDECTYVLGEMYPGIEFKDGGKSMAAITAGPTDPDAPDLPVEDVEVGEALA